MNPETGAQDIIKGDTTDEDSNVVCYLPHLSTANLSANLESSDSNSGDNGSSGYTLSSLIIVLMIGLFSLWFNCIDLYII